MRKLGLSGLVAATIVLVAIVAVAVWPRYIARNANVAGAAALPTMAPVTADYLTRDKLVAFWEKAENEHHPGDMISPDHLAEQYLQRYRERMDIDDVLRAERAARQSLIAQPNGNLPGLLELASIYLTLHQFHAAIAVTRHIEQIDPGDAMMNTRDASLSMEVGDYARAERMLDTVPEKRRDDGWSVVESRYLELTGHLAEARELLAKASAFQNSNFDAPAEQRAWYFFRQGEMAFEAGDNDAALAFEREAVTVFPNYADALRTLARIECARHEWQQCETDAIASANIVPYPETLGYKSDAQRALGDTAGAAQTADLIHAVGKLGDQQHITDRLLANYYSDHHVFPHDAYAIAKNELNARDDLFTEDTLAWASANDGRWDEARTHSANALKYHTENSLLEYHAAVIAEHFGDRAAEQAHLARALALNGSFDAAFADDARAKLASTLKCDRENEYHVYKFGAAARGNTRSMIGGFSPRALGRVFDDSPGETRSKIVALYVLLVGANIGAWVLAFAAFANRPVLLGTALLAYTFGLRHAVDADHISAIDNVTRKLMQDGKKPVSVGFFFSLGHSTIVVALSAAIAFAATIVHRSLPALESVGGVIGTSVSALFLYAIAAINIVVLVEVYRAFRTVRRGGTYSEHTMDASLNKRGLWCRILQPFMKMIGSSWKMYPLGVLFGLGFDTATEVGILGIAALEASKGLPVYTIMVFPLLFTVGMCLLDTTDGVLMLGAYGWAFVKPVRKLYYNLNITLVSVLVALLVGTVEALSIIGPQLGFKGALWSVVDRISDNFGMIGVAIIGIFVLSWLVSTAVYKLRRYDELEPVVAPQTAA